MPRRVVAYIDGFNMYHSIDRHLWDEYKWTDYRKIVTSYLWQDDELMDIFLFTAEPTWNPEKLTRHKAFMDVMARHSGIRIIYSKYSSVVRNFEWDKMQTVDRVTQEPLRIRVQPKKFAYKTFEEKQTDVKMALYILEWAFRDYYDKALIFSWDSDIAPAIVMAKQHFPKKKFKWILPINGKWHVMSRACDEVRTLNSQILEDSKLPDEISIGRHLFVNPYKKRMPPNKGDIQGWGPLTGCASSIS